MEKNDLLESIAVTAYNVGFGAKKHFATYDIAEKLPGLISFLSMAFGTYALVVEELSVKILSASIIVLGIIGLYVSFYESNKTQYDKVGTKLTLLFDELRYLYMSAKIKHDEKDIAQIQEKLRDIEQEYYEISISKQIIFSDWYAHYKFFWQQQTDWINEQKKFGLFRDKIPLSFLITSLITLVITVLIVLKKYRFLCQ